jgi:ribonuclease HI
MNYYAVKTGRNPGIYATWAECKDQIDGFPRAQYKKFSTKEAADAFIAATYMISHVRPVLQICPFEKTHDYIPTKWTQFGGEYYIFTDGSYQSKTHASGIAVFFGSQHPSNIGEYYEGLTSNQCELMAILYALQVIIKHSDSLTGAHINIVSDSEYSINCVTKWVTKWRANGWKASTGEEIKNRKIIANCDKCVQHLASSDVGIVLNFVHINSHTSAPPSASIGTLEYILWAGNRDADAIATRRIN